MRVYFEDRSYVEISKSTAPNKYFVTVGARQDGEIIVNSAEVTTDELRELLSDIPHETKPKPKAKPKPKSSKPKSKKETKPKKKTTRKKRATKAKPVEKIEKPASNTTIETNLVDGYI